MAGKPVISLNVELTGLNRSINQFAIETGRTRKDVAKQAMRGMIRYALTQTPPAGKVAGKAAQRAGQGAIDRDLKKMGFRPVVLKHKRQENPLFADPDEYHRGVLEKSQTRYLFFVDKTKFNKMKRRLYDAIGKVLSGWIAGADAVGVNDIPAWVARHGSGRGSASVVDNRNITTFVATNRVPDGASEIAFEMERRKPYWAFYARSDLDRQLKAKLAGNWHK